MIFPPAKPSLSLFQFTLSLSGCSPRTLTRQLYQLSSYLFSGLPFILFTSRSKVSFGYTLTPSLIASHCVAISNYLHLSLNHKYKTKLKDTHNNNFLIYFNVMLTHTVLSFLFSYIYECMLLLPLIIANKQFIRLFNINTRHKTGYF